VTTTEPHVARWEPATDDTTCPTCAAPIGAGDLVAVLDTRPPTRCCAACIDHD
jgi:hypothetical protein